MSEQFSVDQFTQYFTVQNLLRKQIAEEGTTEKFNPIIDFKKEQIDWRSKTRMRSNSNEFMESPLKSVSFKQKIGSPSTKKSDSKKRVRI